MRGVREIWAHPGKKTMGSRRRSEVGDRQSKTAAQNNNEPRCPRKFLTQPTEFEKSGVLQHPLANFAVIKPVLGAGEKQNQERNVRNPGQPHRGKRSNRTRPTLHRFGWARIRWGREP